MQEIILIGDKRVREVPVKECGELLVDLLTYNPELAFDLTRICVHNNTRNVSYVRETVAQMLMKVQCNLPRNIRLLIKEGHRPVALQEQYWNNYYNKILTRHSEWNEGQVYDECSKFVAPLEVAPHTTGGAVDLTLIDENGNWLDMGTQFNASPLDTNKATYTQAPNINSTAKENRKTLIDAMNTVGFINYPTEWWHWSYGDKYWGLHNNKAAIYSGIDLSD